MSEIKIGDVIHENRLWLVVIANHNGESLRFLAVVAAEGDKERGAVAADPEEHLKRLDLGEPGPGCDGLSCRTFEMVSGKWGPSYLGPADEWRMLSGGELWAINRGAITREVQDWLIGERSVDEGEGEPWVM